jgi:PPE-repeat protein
MTAALDFAMLPPEVNSGRMYSGAGSGPMLAAASAWHGLAAELRSTALSYGSVLTALTGEEWHGPASAAMAAAAAPYAAWLGTTAEQAEQTAAQAEAAAAAYEAAFAETVPPPVIAANRAQLMALIATNILGQNTPAIAATEAQYAEMWAQDAAAMYGYAASSAVASQLSQFTEPQQTTSPGGLAAQSAAVTQAVATPAGSQQGTLSQLMSALPSTLQGLSSPASSQTPASEIVGLLTGSGSGSSTLDNLWAAWGPNANVWNTAFSSGFYMPSNTMAPFLSLLGQGSAAGDVAEAAGQAASGAVGEAAGVPAIGGVGSGVSAGLGHAPIVGALSVPPSWTAPAPLAGPLASSLGGTPMVAPPALAAGMPGMPIGATGGQPYGRAVPQYGFRPTFVARPPAAG